MKLLRYGPMGQEKPGLLDAKGAIRDLSEVLPDLDGNGISPASLERLGALDEQTLPVVEGNPRLGAPVAGVGKFIAIGLNYTDHAKEANMPIPTEPVVFMKAMSCLCGPNDDVITAARIRPRLDWEVELGDRDRAKAQYVSVETTRWIMSPATASSTTCRSATTSSSAAARGTRARASTPSARSARGW